MEPTARGHPRSGARQVPTTARGSCSIMGTRFGTTRIPLTELFLCSKLQNKKLLCLLEHKSNHGPEILRDQDLENSVDSSEATHVRAGSSETAHMYTEHLLRDAPP